MKLPGSSAALVLATAFALVGTAQAQNLLSVPFADAPVRYEASDDSLRLAASGWARPGLGRLSAISLASRRLARQRALSALSAYLHEQARAVGLSSAVRESLCSRALAAAVEGTVRPLSDGSVVLELRMPCKSLQHQGEGVGLCKR